MVTYVCEECGRAQKLQDKKAVWTSWLRCKCGAQAVEARGTRQSSGGLWTTTGGFGGSGEGSLSRAVHKSQLKEQLAEDRKLGVENVVEYKVDEKGMARPCFKSMYGRRKWDRAHHFYDGDSYFG